ncbi:MAG: hypothetical protein E6I41_00735 [Chloroflexi bacterium]|nr:MAG: hypothetical protein E6I41_00735 [Chloroflexota bacterium]
MTTSAAATSPVGPCTERRMMISSPITIKITGHRSASWRRRSNGIRPVLTSSARIPTRIRTAGQKKLR